MMVGLTATHVMADTTFLKRGSGGCVPTLEASRRPGTVPERRIRLMVKPGLRRNNVSRPRRCWRDQVSVGLGAPQNSLRSWRRSLRPPDPVQEAEETEA